MVVVVVVVMVVVVVGVAVAAGVVLVAETQDFGLSPTLRVLAVLAVAAAKQYRINSTSSMSGSSRGCRRNNKIIVCAFFS